MSAGQRCRPRPPPGAAAAAAAATLLLVAAAHAAGAAASAGEAEEEVVDVAWRVPERRLKPEGGHAEEIVAEEFEVAFVANGTRYELLLRRNRALLKKGAKHWLLREDGSKQEGPMPTACFYLGEVLGDPSGGAGLSTCSGAGLSGLVLAHGGALALEPLDDGRAVAPLASPSARGRVRHLVRHVTNAEILDFQADVARYVRGAGHKVPATRGDVPGARRLAGSDTKFVEVQVVNDYRRYQAFGEYGGLSKLANHSVSVLNAVTATYRNPTANNSKFPYTIQVVLVSQMTFLHVDPWEKTVAMVGKETDCQSLLQLFHQWGENQMMADTGAPGYDNRVLLSGRDFDGTTIGLAGMSTMCDLTRSGSVVMCGPNDKDVSRCSATVAHEMGHNLGMLHDNVTNPCPAVGFVMQAVLYGDGSSQFSSCSAGYLGAFFERTYMANGACLENKPLYVEGAPLCGNGFVEQGEDCDCGGAACSAVGDPCCDGRTCKFVSPDVECSMLAGPCCRSCRFVNASDKVVCRAQRNSCDLPEWCPGGTDQCPQDRFAYPGSECVVEGYAGLCFGGRCESVNYTCSVDIDRDFAGHWDLTARCASYNDACGQLVCHNASDARDYKCGQSFVTHGKSMAVPDGAPCWFPGSLLGQRRGMCSSGKCVLPHTLAVVPMCGNGGIDFGEECDCGTALVDPCCNCTSCTLLPGAQCSRAEPCCDSTCRFNANGTVCRPNVSACDEAEVCSGTSGICPPDVGKKWGTPCVASDGNASTCYAKVCLNSLDQQCRAKNASLPYAEYNTDGRTVSIYQLCTALACCEQCMRMDGLYTVGTTVVTNPYTCKTCYRRTQGVQSFVVDGQTRTVYLEAPLDGTVLSNPALMCVGAAAVTPNSTCRSGEFLEASVGRCLPCDAACAECSGPTNFDCVGGCKFGSDSRGACAMSLTQYYLAYLTFPNLSTTTPSTTSTTSRTTVTRRTTTTTVASADGSTITSTTTTSTAKRGEGREVSAASPPTLHGWLPRVRLLLLLLAWPQRYAQ